MGRKEKPDCELVYPPGNSQKKKKKKRVPGNCLAGREREEPSSILWFLIGGRKRKSFCKLAVLSPPGFLPPAASTEDVVPVSCCSARGSLIKRMSRCHRSLGFVCRATARLPRQTLPGLGAPCLITPGPLEAPALAKSGTSPQLSGVVVPPLRCPCK